jgi:hypothetical protein
MSTQKEVREAIINSATEQFRSLLDTHFVAISKAATESFIDDENQTEPMAKAAVSVEFGAISHAPRVTVKIGWSARFKDESEQEVDPLQSKLPLAKDGGAS